MYLVLWWSQIGHHLYTQLNMNLYLWTYATYPKSHRHPPEHRVNQSIVFEYLKITRSFQYINIDRNLTSIFDEMADTCRINSLKESLWETYKILILLFNVLFKSFTCISKWNQKKKHITSFQKSNSDFHCFSYIC
jgi:hypothetical protein